jgi:hypothetical protein
MGVISAVAVGITAPIAFSQSTAAPVAEWIAMTLMDLDNSPDTLKLVCRVTELRCRQRCGAARN